MYYVLGEAGYNIGWWSKMEIEYEQKLRITLEDEQLEVLYLELKVLEKVNDAKYTGDNKQAFDGEFEVLGVIYAHLKRIAGERGLS